MFSLRKIHEELGKEKYRAEVSSMFEVLDDLDARWILKLPGKRLQRITKFPAKKVCVIVN
jgi:hypothetical protein